MRNGTTTRSTILAEVPALATTVRDNSFGERYAEWLAARAQIETLNADEHCSDKEMGAANDRVIAAEWGLIVTPLYDASDRRARALATQAIMFRSFVDGEPTDNRHLAMLSSLVADIMVRKE